MHYFALVDCNNFYASCERVFQPRYQHTPIVVLSNNDGCVVARSQEAKDIGIPMGIPAFQVRPLVRQRGVKVFSSNYSLYGDISRRIMDILDQHCADLEVYSIDEAFLLLDLHGQTPCSLLHWAQALQHKIAQWVGIPVSVGIAPTKTLAKLANHIAKRQTDTGVYFLSPQDERLAHIPIGQVWGVGRAYAQRLPHITTVAQLVRIEEGWMRREFGVVGLRLLKELQGTPCHDLEPPPTERKHTMVSRSFATEISDREELGERIAINATRLGEKLRQYQQQASVLTIYLWTNKHKTPDDQRRAFAQTVELPLATANTNTLIRWARAVLYRLYRPGVAYKKSGLLASHLSPAQHLQTNLFVPHTDEQTFKKVNAVMDRLNQKMGRHTVHFAATGASPAFRMRQEHRSPRYTTCWTELREVRK